MLKDIVPEKKEIKVGNASFEVTGLSIETIVSLCNSHMKELETLFDDQVEFMAILKEAPEFVAKVIAEAAGEPKEVKRVAKLPAGVQIDTLKEIWKLTQVSGEDLGNALRGFGNAMEKLTQDIGREKAPSVNTSSPLPKPQISSLDQDTEKAKS